MREQCLTAAVQRMQTVFILMDSDRSIDGRGANLNNHTFEFCFLSGGFLCVFVSLQGVSLCGSDYIFLSALEYPACVLLRPSLSEFTYTHRHLCFHM